MKKNIIFTVAGLATAGVVAIIERKKIGNFFKNLVHNADDDEEEYMEFSEDPECIKFYMDRFGLDEATTVDLINVIYEEVTSCNEESKDAGEFDEMLAQSLIGFYPVGTIMEKGYDIDDIVKAYHDYNTSLFGDVPPVGSFDEEGTEE